jgi:hypothetical protein
MEAKNQARQDRDIFDQPKSSEMPENQTVDPICMTDNCTVKPPRLMVLAMTAPPAMEIPATEDFQIAPNVADQIVTVVKTITVTTTKKHEADVIKQLEQTASHQQPDQSPKAEQPKVGIINDNGEFAPWIMQLVTMLVALSGAAAAWYGAVRKK